MSNPRGEMNYEFTTDKEEFTYKDADGSEMKAIAYWNDDRTTLTEETQKKTDKGWNKITMVRYLKNGEMYLELINKDKVKCIRIFKKTN